MMRHHLHMPSYFLGTFTEYPYDKFLYMDYVCFYRFYRKNLLAALFLFFLRIMGGMTVSSSLPNSFQRAAKNSLFLGSNTRAEARGSFGVGE